MSGNVPAREDVGLRDGPLTLKELIQFLCIIGVILAVLAAAMLTRSSSGLAVRISESAYDSQASIFIAMPPSFTDSLSEEQRFEAICEALSLRVEREAKDRGKTVVKIDTVLIDPRWLGFKVFWE